MEEKPKKSYRLWHMLVAFVLGSAVVAGVVFVPAMAGQGFMRFTNSKAVLIQDGKGVDTGTGNQNCATVYQVQQMQDLMNKWMNPYSSNLAAWVRPLSGGVYNLTNMVASYTGDWDGRFSQLADGEKNHFFSLVSLLHPYTGLLNERLNEL
ncbi:MAG: hypothetical protein V1679_00410 [Candidatus Peregrinibacteria bacterium]